MATIRKRIGASGKVSWHVQIRRAGWPPVTETLPSRRQAEEWMRQTELELDKGTYVDPSLARKTPLSALIETYLVEITDKRPSEDSRKVERYRLERFLREEIALCRTAVANLRPEHFEAYMQRRLQQHVSRGGEPWKPALVPPGRYRKDGTPRKNAAGSKAPPKPPKLMTASAVKRELTILEGVIEHSRRRLGLTYNPVNRRDVKRPHVDDERMARLEPEEIRKLIAECYAARNPWIGPLVELAFEVGARRGNLLRLQRGDVNVNGGSLLLRGVKNSRRPDQVLNVTVGLSPRAIEILETTASPIDRADDRVFPISAETLKQAFERARKRAGVAHFRLHDARHDRAATLVEAGWSDIAVASQTGHKDLKSLKRYANLRPSHLAAKLAELPRRK